MADSQIRQREHPGVSFGQLSQKIDKDIKIKLGLAELIFQALILLLLV